MKLVRLLERLRSGARATLQSVGQQLGRELAKGSAGELAAVRAGIASLGQGDDYSAGYRAALDDLLAGFLLTHESEEDLAAAVRTVQARSGWAELLQALDTAPRRNTELAELTGRDRAVVSRALGAFVRNGWIQEATTGPGADGRARWYRLTPPGRRLVERLTQAPGRPPDRGLIGFVLDMVVELAVARRVSSRELRRMCEAALGDRSSDDVIDSVMELAADRGLARQTEAGVFWATEITAQHRLASELEALVERGLGDDARGAGLPGLVDKIQRLAPAGTKLFVRTSRLRDKWDAFLRLQRGLDARTLDDQDAELATGIPTDGAFVLYDNLMLYLRDQRRGALQAASQRACLASADAAPVADLELVTVDA